MKYFLIGLLTITSFLSFSHEGHPMPSKYKTKHVIILVLDGPRWSETFGDTSYQYVPYLKHKLAPQGVFFNHFSNDGPTYTLSGHTAMTTGVYQKIDNTGKQIPKNPSIFQYYLKQHQVDKRKTWVLTSKGKLNILGFTKKKGWVREYYPCVYSGLNGSATGYPSDAKMVPIFLDIIKKNIPDLAIINLLEIDAWAHQNRWDKYISSIIQNDKFSYDIWQFIQSIPQMRGNTTIFITNDHGRHLDGHKDGFVSHGDKCEGCKHISLIGIGPDFQVGTEVDKPYDLIDITATAAELMNIDMPTAKGEVIWDMFKPKSRPKVEGEQSDKN